MGAPEKKITNNRLKNLDPESERMFRINAGMGWTGKILHRSQNKIILENPRPLHAAPKGWPDMCGFKSVTITPDMVGQKVAVFVGEEVKSSGKLSAAQEAFRDLIVSFGGIFRVLRK